LPLAAGDLDDGAAVILLKLALSDGKRFDPTVGTGGHAPEEIHVIPPTLTVKWYTSVAQRRYSFASL